MANGDDPKAVDQGSAVEDFDFDHFFSQSVLGDDSSSASDSMSSEGGPASFAPVVLSKPSSGKQFEASDVEPEFGPVDLSKPNSDEQFESSSVSIDLQVVSPDAMGEDAVFSAGDELPSEATTETNAKDGKDEKDEVDPPDDSDGKSPIDTELVSLNQRWLGVACAWGAVQLTMNGAAIFSPPAATSTTSLLLYLVILNLFGAAALVAPIMLWRTANKEDKYSIANIVLCLSMMAVVLAATILLTEFFRYDFTMKIS